MDPNMASPKQNSKVLEMDPIYSDIKSSIGNMLDITSRIDERLKILYERDEEYREQLQELSKQVNSILQRLATLDAVVSPACEEIMTIKARMHEMEIKISNFSLTMNTQTHKLDKYLDWAFKIAITAVGIYATYMIGK